MNVAGGACSLWDEDDDDGAGDEEDDGMQTECAEAPLKMHRVWHRVIGQSLIRCRSDINK